MMKIELEETVKELINLHREDKAAEATRSFWNGCLRTMIACLAVFLILGLGMHARGWKLMPQVVEAPGPIGDAPPLETTAAVPLRPLPGPPPPIPGPPPGVEKK